MHVHLTDESLRFGHGVVRTDDGPITVEQLQRFLIQHDANVTVRPVTDPAATASADAYEIPLRLRRAMAIRHPRSVAAPDDIAARRNTARNDKRAAAVPVRDARVVRRKRSAGRRPAHERRGSPRSTAAPSARPCETEVEDDVESSWAAASRSPRACPRCGRGGRHVPSCATGLGCHRRTPPSASRPASTAEQTRRPPAPWLLVAVFGIRAGRRSGRSVTEPTLASRPPRRTGCSASPRLRVTPTPAVYAAGGRGEAWTTRQRLTRSQAEPATGPASDSLDRGRARHHDVRVRRRASGHGVRATGPAAGCGVRR